MKEFKDIEHILSHVRKAVEEYGMIEDGDKIAVGISGGKDSLTLLCALAKLRRFLPKKYELLGISVDMGFENVDFSEIQNLCDELEVPFKVVKTDIYEIIFNVRKEKNPASQKHFTWQCYPSQMKDKDFPRQTKTKGVHHH